MNNKNYISVEPNKILNLSFEKSLDLLISLIGENNFQKALNFEIKSPVNNYSSSQWLKSSKIIGINPRITKTFWGIVKYAITFPEEAIHIMPLWESGDGSIYVQNSWRLNQDFIDYDLVKLGMNTCEKQLKFIINILHALGKSVGFDVMLHADNFSEIVMLNPDFFEWIKLNEEKSAQDYSIDTYNISQNIKQLIINKYKLPDNFYNLSETERSEMLFPEDIDKFNRRIEIRKLIRNEGYEPLPVVEHFPMRPIKFLKMEHSKNDNWAIFDIDNRDKNSIIIGAITPYKFYHIKDGYPLKNNIDEKVLNYFVSHINHFQQEYDFDFIRADMAHNQISHSHNERNKDMKCKEVWAILKDTIQKYKPYFGTFAESFLTDYYISGIQDMVNKNFDIVLGELNYRYLNEKYIELLYEYVINLRKYDFVPILTIYTNDGDIEDNNKYYVSLEANICRYFVSMFLKMPSYMGIGYEVRNLEPQKLCNYSNLYVKQRKSNYKFGNNDKQFSYISEIRKLYQKYCKIIRTSSMTYYDKREEKQLVWCYEYNNKKLLCAVNLNPSVNYIQTETITSNAKLIYTNSTYNEIYDEISTDNIFKINNIYIGEFVIYELDN